MTTAPYRIARADYADAILYILRRMDGSATATAVLEQVYALMEPHLSEDDRAPVPSTGEPRWRNDARWARDALIRQGLLEPTRLSGTGRWMLSSTGRMSAPADGPVPGPRRGTHNPLRGVSTRSIRGGRPSAEPNARLGYLAAAFERAANAPVGSSANPAMGEVMETLGRILEQLCSVPSATATREATKAPRQNARTTLSPPKRPPTHATRGVNGVDLPRLEAFVDTRWTPQLRRSPWRGSVAPDDVARFDELAPLPILATLLAARQGWVPLAPAARLAASCARSSIGMPGSSRVAFGSVLATPNAAAAHAVIHDGLLHRALTAWVQLLDAEADDSTVLVAALLRRWVHGIRSITGEVEVWPALPGGGAWAPVLGTHADLPAPSEDEDAAAELDAWLRSQPPDRRSLPMPAVGSLTWSAQAGWGEVVADLSSQSYGKFSVAMVMSVHPAQYNRHKVRGFRDVGALRDTGALPDPLLPIAHRVHELVRAAIGNARPRRA